MKITIPELSLVLLIGPSGAGKSTFARKHFRTTEVLSSDAYRGIVSDDETSQEATKAAFEALHFVAAKRLEAGRLTVIDATNVRDDARRPLLALAKQHHVLPTAIVLDMPERLCIERNRLRPDRQFGGHVVRGHRQALRRSIRSLQKEGFRSVHVLSSPEEAESAVVERQPLWTNKRSEHGPFDIIGDVHGCFDELCALLDRLGYRVEPGPTSAGPSWRVTSPPGRKVVFVGDLVDRGPKSADVLALAMGMVEAGQALCVSGNHEAKLLRKLRGKDVKVSHGLAETLASLEPQPDAFKQRVTTFVDDLVSHYVLDDGKLVVAHAGLKESLQGRASGTVRSFALYGETTGETDEYGLPVRLNWAAEYRGKAMVVYGHTPVPEAEWLNRTIDIDTGCCFGGKLTALRYPELELVDVPAVRMYYTPAKPLAPVVETRTAQQVSDDVLDREDVSGRKHLSTRLAGTITVREEYAAAALEAMSRFAVDPRWLVYLPPTMSPSETSARPEWLEHPAEAFAYFRANEVPRVVCEEKHMGSRAVVVVCRDPAVARRRFGFEAEADGVIYTRTGRPFFADAATESALLARVRTAMDRAELWDELATDWAVLDCELLPWSAKAQELLRSQYAATGSASRAALGRSLDVLEHARSAGGDVDALLQRLRGRAETVENYVAAYRRYCWPVASADDLKLAPFHLLATERAVHVSRDHGWHMETLAKLAGPGILATPYRVVDLADAASEAAAIEWWLSLTAQGGEGMVVKPHSFVARGSRGLIQPAVKCRGREYLRIIYGPEYTLPGNLERLRSRGLAAKRNLASREFALGIEALERFVSREPLRRVHECVFGVLALESEPVDPRL